MYCERVEPGVLLGFVVLLVDVAATASPRGSDMGPTGGVSGLPMLDAMIPAGRSWRDAAAEPGGTRLICIEEVMG